jgi:murein DD-endopeptidase MepM/ murein hydrolase activator NlpD
LNAEGRILSQNQIALQQLIFLRYYQLFLFSRILWLRKIALENAQNRAEDAESYKDPTGHLALPVENYGDVTGTGMGKAVAGEFHAGEDIGARKGESVKAVAEAKIAHIGTVGGDKAIGGGQYGNYVVLDHGNGVYTMYGHLDSTKKFKVGDKVNEGDEIGTVGTTGRSSGAHLHYEIIRDKQGRANLSYSESNSDAKNLEFQKFIRSTENADIEAGKLDYKNPKLTNRLSIDPEKQVNLGNFKTMKDLRNFYSPDNKGSKELFKNIDITSPRLPEHPTANPHPTGGCGIRCGFF